jgi:hypothetical protein
MQRKEPAKSNSNPNTPGVVEGEGWLLERDARDIDSNGSPFAQAQD